jgi:hypothetical protein
MPRITAHRKHRHSPNSPPFTHISRAVDAEGQPAHLFDEGYTRTTTTSRSGAITSSSRDPPGSRTPRSRGKCVFPPAYPTEPPVLRFVSVSYHLNASSEGRICLQPLERGYVPNAIVFKMMQSVKQLFLIPDNETPVQLTKLELFRENRDMYDHLARVSCETQAKNSPEEWLAGITASRSGRSRSSGTGRDPRSRESQYQRISRSEHQLP